MTQRAPGRSDRRGISMVGLFRGFPDHAPADEQFILRRCPSRAHCPRHGLTNVQTAAGRKIIPYLRRGKDCAEPSGAKTATITE